MSQDRPTLDLSFMTPEWMERHGDAPDVVCSSTPMPTHEEYKAVFRRRYIDIFSEFVPPETAASFFDEADWDDMQKMTPEEAVAEEMQYWENE